MRERLRHVGRMGEKIGAVDLVEVDLLHPQTRQRGVQRLFEVGWTGVVRHASHDPALGRQDHPLAQARRLGQHPAKQGLGRAESALAGQAVDVGRIEQGDARFERRLDLGARRDDVVAGEAPHAPRQRRNLDAALPQGAG
jgi:hypothetical protein